MGYKCDFHIHSYYSDGTMKPTDLVKMYKEQDYDIISLTDHDGIDGVNEAVIAGDALEIRVIPGIEFSTECDVEGRGLELHLLGYYIDIENAALRERLVDIRNEREIRNEKLLALLREKGFDLTWEDLRERPGQSYIGKPNFARALKKKGYELPNMWEVFDCVEKKKICTSEAIDLVKGAGGISVLAHPLKTKGLGNPSEEAFWDNLDHLLRRLKKDGLKGLECYHPSASHEEALRLVKLAAKYHLHITEGSDFHGE